MKSQQKVTVTKEAVGYIIAVWIVRLYDVDNGVRRCVLADEDVFDGLHEDRVFVVDVGDADANVGGAAVRRQSVVGGNDHEVVRVAVALVVVETPAHALDLVGQLGRVNQVGPVGPSVRLVK